MTATFAAAVALRTAQDRLSELGQWLPIDGDPDAPLGTPVDHNPTGHRRALWQPDRPASFRASVPPVRVPDFARAAGLNTWSADPAFGIVVGPVPATEPDTIRSAATAVGGSVILPRSGRTEGPPPTD